MNALTGAIGTRGIWLALCLAVAVLMTPFLHRAPPVGQDEVQIIELGRAALHPDTDWSMMWDVQASAPLLPLPWLGKVIQEGALQAGGLLVGWPRFTALLGAIAAATALLGWLRARGTPRLAALTVSFAFLTDPLFADAYRAGRIDGAAMAALLAGCWLLRQQVTAVEAGRRLSNLRLAAAGAAVVASAFLWPSAVFLGPLAAIELLAVGRAYARSRDLGLAPALWRAAWPALAGGLGVLLLLLAPLAAQWDGVRRSVAGIGAVQRFAAEIRIPVVQVFAVYTPVLLLAGLAGLLWRRDWPVLLGLVVALGLMYQTMIYPARVVYLIPYLAVIVAEASRVAFALAPGSRRRSAWVLLLSCLVAFNGWQVLFARPWATFSPPPAAKRTEASLASAIGPGPHRVLLEDWGSYFEGRRLGWRLYRPGSPVPVERYRDFLLTLDYVIVRQQPLYDTTRRIVRGDAFEFLAVVPAETGGALEIYRPGRR